MNRFFALIFLFLSSALYAQENVSVLPADTIMTMSNVDVKPDYKGGEKAFYMYVAKNFKYPKEALEANIQGKIVVEFIIEKDGSMSNYKFTRNLRYGTDKEVLRVLAASPKWIPGMKNGQLVRVKHIVPVTISLSSGAPQSGASKTRSNPNTW